MVMGGRRMKTLAQSNCPRRFVGLCGWHCIAILTATLCFPGSLLAEGDDWALLVEDEGIRVTIREVPDRDLPVFRGVVTISAPIFEIMGVLQDIDRHPEWMDSCIEARRLKRVHLLESIVYNRTDAPWPISDRDTVVRSQASFDRDKGAFYIDIHSVKSELMGEVDGVVRVPRMHGHYRLEQVGPEQTRVEYQIDTDPGGWLPNWLIRMVTRRIPFKTLDNLRNRVAQTSKEQTYKVYVQSLEKLKGQSVEELKRQPVEELEQQ